jgi:molybdopterin-guanine dinucleotide biosynthesis protein
MENSLNQVSKVLELIASNVDSILHEGNFKRENIERIELGLLRYRKYMNEPENYEGKVQAERETAEWLGEASYTIEPLSLEEEERLEYLSSVYSCGEQ